MIPSLSFFLKCVLNFIVIPVRLAFTRFPFCSFFFALYVCIYFISLSFFNPVAKAMAWFGLVAKVVKIIKFNEIIRLCLNLRVSFSYVVSLLWFSAKSRVK